MKRHKKYLQLKKQGNSYEGANNETDFCSLIDAEFKKEVMKILKELRMTTNSNADYFIKELETESRSQ